MADLYQANPNNSYLNVGQTTATPIRTGNPNTDSFLDSLPEDQKQQAHQDINSPLMGDEVAQLLQNRRETGYVPTQQEYQTYAKWSDKQQHSILDGLSEGFNGVMHTFGEAAGQFIQHPLDTTEKLPASVAEAFFQGTRNFYGMLAQSQDPNSVLFKWKNALASDGSSDAYNQFLEALKFNDHSADLAEGKTTLLMDKDAINHEVTQAASYIADPTLFIPFGEIASGGLRAIGMGSKLAAIGAKADMIGNKILAGGLKWGVGTPLEFMGGAVRGTIDYATHIGGQAFEATTGVGINEFKATAKLAGVGSSVAGLAGHGVPVLSDISNAYIAGTSARGLGEAVNAIAGQIDKQSVFGRGINSYARQALEDTKAAGIALSPHAQSLLKILDAVDPLFSYSSDILKGAAHGAVIGGTLGYLGEGEEGLYHGIGAGVALGGIGAGVGRLTSDALGGTGVMRRAIQSEMVLKGYESMGQTEKVQFWKELRLRAKDPDMVNAVISGIDNVCPLHEIHAMNPEEFNSWSEKNGYDVSTGKFAETSRILDTLENRNHKGEVLGILRDNGDKFAGDSKAFEEDLNTNKSMKLRWNKLTEEQKGVVLENIDSHADFIKENGTGKLKDYYADHTAAEKYTQQVNDTHTKSPEAAKKQIDALLSGHKDANGELTQRGKLLADKLRNEGYLDKDGSILARRSMMDSDLTLKQFQSIAGMVTRREADGKVHIYINTDAMDRSTLPHELFHAIMKESPMKKEFTDRLIQKLIGKYDSKGNVIEAGSVTPDELKKFFNRYIESENRNAHPDKIKSLKDNLDKSIEEYKSRGKGERVDISTATPLEHYAEEFGAYYFANFLQGKNRDFLFHGGQLHGIAGILDSAKSSWLNFWGDKIGNASSFDFSNIKDFQISKSFEGKRNAAFDSFMTDFVRANSMINKGGFDINRLSPDAQAHYLEANGIRGFGVRDKNGKIVKFKSDQQAIAEQIRIGKEIYKILNGLDPELRKNGTITDGEGNLSGRPNTAEVDAIVKSGLVPKAWIDKVVRGYDILEGKGGNLIDFGYQGKTAQIGDYAYPRLVGSDVPFKHRTAILTGVDFKVGADGKMYSLFHTLDKKVIDARGNNLWADPRNRALWGGDRSAFEADFFKYLSNASKAAGDVTRRPSHLLLDHGDGMGTLRRNTLHQMLGMAKSEGEVYINKPTAEIPFGIRQSVTTFNVDGISNLRVDNGVRWDYNTDNAAKDLSRNFMPSEMKSEETPNGRIIKHATGYRILESIDKKFRLITPEGKDLGRFDSIANAGRAAQKHFNETFDKSVEGKDKPVPNTEIPPSRVKYKDKRVQTILDDNKIEQAVIEALEKEIIGITSKENYPESAANYYAKPFKDAIEAIKRDGLIKAVSDEDASHIKLLQGQVIKPDVSSLGDIDIGIPHYAKELKVSYLLDKLTKLAQHEYDAMYPMEIKSALHPRLAQIFQDYPNLTAQGLLKKLVVYGSQGSRMFQEATEIGLIDLLKSKTKSKTEINRVFDLQKQEFNGEVRTSERQVPVQTPFTPSEIQEVLDFAKSKEIKVTIEEGAREVSGMDTSKYTLGGAKDNYKETAIRINPEYAHGISGHYGENTIVHFRTTERIDADGNRHLFIEEVQANNTYKKSGQTEADTRKLKRDEASLPVLERIFQEGKNRGLFTKYDNLGYEQNGYQSSVRVFFQSIEQKQQDGELRKIFLENRETLKRFLGDSDIDTAGLVIESHFYRAVEDHYRHILNNADLIKKWETEIKEYENKESPNFKYLKELNEINIKESQNRILNSEKEIMDSFENVILGDRKPPANSKIPAMTDAVLSIPELKEYFDAAKELAVKISNFDEFLINSRTNEVAGLNTYAMNPHHLEATISDIKTRIQQAKAVVTPLPLTSAKDWTLTALKGIIRQAIRDGLNKITLTHPDDSPTTSHMAGDSRTSLYGKIIPEFWGSWLRKYGIEIKQSNSMADSTLAQAKNRVAEVSNKIHDANKKVLERFEQVGSSENPEVITALSKILATPVHLYDGDLMNYSSLAGKVNDVQLQEGIKNVLLLKQTEWDNYNDVLRLQEQTVAKQNGVSSTGLSSNKAINARISAEAIDRGMTFELNDRIKRDFLDGKIQTHAMPAEGEQGGRVYDQNSKEFKTGFIGKWAEENPERLKGYDLQFIDRGTKYGTHNVRIRLQDNSTVGMTQDVGHITADIDPKTKVASLSSNIGVKYRGNKLSYALYSEMAERLRSMGVEKVDGTIINPEGIPIKVRERIIGNTKVLRSDGSSGLPIDYKQGSRIIQKRQAESGNTWGGLDVVNELDFNARYMPTEGVNAPVNEANRNFILDTITANDNSRRALEEGMKQAKDRKQNFITIDNINPDLLRGEAVVMHSPDNAGVEPVQIGRFTVNPRGGVRYTSENPTLGWAGVKAGLGKQINENGEYNFKKGNGWNSGVGLIKGEYSKMKGTHIGLEVFLRNLQKYTDNNVLTEEQTIQILKNGLGDIGDTRRPLDTIVEGILAKSAKHEAPYTIDGRRTAIEKMTETKGSASLWKYLQSDLTKLEPQVEGFSSEGVTNAKQFIKALLEPMYEAVSDPLTRHAKVGEVYGYLMFRSPVIEPLSDVHPSYKYSVQPEKGGSPVQLDILSTPMSARKAFTNRITDGVVSPLPESKAGFVVSTGQKHIPTMRGTFMPAEQWNKDQSLGSKIITSTKGYIIMQSNTKFKLYNPYKTLIGVYDNIDQAKNKVEKSKLQR